MAPHRVTGWRRLGGQDGTVPYRVETVRRCAGESTTVALPSLAYGQKCSKKLQTSLEHLEHKASTRSSTIDDEVEASICAILKKKGTVSCKTAQHLRSFWTRFGARAANIESFDVEAQSRGSRAKQYRSASEPRCDRARFGPRLSRASQISKTNQQLL